MKQYLDLVDYVLKNGVREVNRTGVATLTVFAYSYRVNLQEGYPLLTTKQMFFNSMVHELLWYLSGEAHIRNLQKKTAIWNAWADKEGHLETAYGRFWRRFPMPNASLERENWGARWVWNDPETGQPVFDQIRFVLDTLREIKENPATSNRRRMVVSAWHPANAAESKLPPCHYTFVFSVIGKRLNCHLTQRSGDIALGIPFNLAAYALLTMIIAQETGFEPGVFAHTIIDAHIYENHIETIKKQCSRQPLPLPKIAIACKPILELTFEDIHLIDYQSHPRLKFEVAV
ncbi:MAG TPA: thymidylate synthase [Candidatus Marinimicrobia bacterium]|nr:thymidylate synthase [Candidatus Neomarinimicrobiota bacterium]